MKFDTYTLQDLASIKYGKNQMKVASSEGNVPIYGTGGLMGYATKSLYDRPSVLIGRKGTIDKVRYVTDPFWTVDTLFYTEIEETLVRPHYLYYAMTLLDLNQFNEGTTIPSLRTETLNRLEFRLPSIEEQRKILSVVEPIEEKIEINERINDNLYQQLDTIYRASYPYLPSDELPAGWNCVPLGTLCDSISIKHSFDKEKLVFLNTGDIENGHFLHSTYSLVQEMPGQAKKSIKTNDILYSEIRPINRHFAFVNFQADDYVVSTKLMVIRSREMDSRRLYHFLTTQDVINELQIEAESRSGTFPQIRFENIQRLPIIIAPPDIELQFTQVLKYYYNMIDSNIFENQYLATLRDSILPKLMSGEIDVSKLDI